MWIIVIIWFIVMCIKEGSPVQKGCAWTVVGIFGFIFLLADIGVDSDGLTSVFWVLVVIALIVGIAVLISKLPPTTNHSHESIRPCEPSRHTEIETSIDRQKPVPHNKPVIPDPKRQKGDNSIYRISKPALLQQEKNQIDIDIDDVEKRLDVFLEKYDAARKDN